jgi:uncharacterized DUF497 family protein
MEFRWNDWNLNHATKHGVLPDEAEALVRRGRARHVGGNKYHVQGRGQAGRYIQVIYLVDPDASIYVIHARPLTDREKRRFRRSNR